MCRSAMKSVRRCGHQSARSGNSCSATPAQWTLQTDAGTADETSAGNDDDGDSGGDISGIRISVCYYVYSCLRTFYGGYSTKSHQGTEPDGIGLASAGGGVQQARFTVGNRPPHVLLKFEGLPAALGEPAFQRALHGLAPSPAGGRAQEVDRESRFMTAARQKVFAVCRLRQPACLRASAACAESAPQCRFCGAGCGQCLQSRVRTPASA